MRNRGCAYFDKGGFRGNVDALITRKGELFDSPFLCDSGGGGGVDGCDCAEILRLIEQGKIDTTPLITHRYKLADIAEAYHLFENKLDGVIKVAVEP